MYEIDEQDRVIELRDLPQSSVGAPVPCVLADERRIILAYDLQDRDPGWDGKTVRVVGRSQADEPIAIVQFNGCAVHMFGPPNDEAFSAHPLAERGLHPYGVFRIERSSWIRKLERMNSVHSQHRPALFWELRHWVFAFHDSTFECVSKDFDVTTTRGSMVEMIPEMVRRLAW